MLRVQTWCAVMVVLTIASSSVAIAGLVWPGSEISQHAQAWFAMLKGGRGRRVQVLRRAHGAPPRWHRAESTSACSAAPRRSNARAVSTPLEVVDDDVTTAGGALQGRQRR